MSFYHIPMFPPDRIPQLWSPPWPAPSSASCQPWRTSPGKVGEFPKKTQIFRQIPWEENMKQLVFQLLKHHRKNHGKSTETNMETRTWKTMKAPGKPLQRRHFFSPFHGRPTLGAHPARAIHKKSHKILEMVLSSGWTCWNNHLQQIQVEAYSQTRMDAWRIGSPPWKSSTWTLQRSDLETSKHWKKRWGGLLIIDHRLKPCCFMATT